MYLIYSIHLYFNAVNLSTIVEERASGSIESNEDPEKSDVTSGEERPRIDIRGCSLSKLTKCSSDSRIKENRIEITPVMGEMQGFGADQQDILMSSMGSSRSMSGMIRTKPVSDVGLKSVVVVYCCFVLTKTRIQDKSV